MEELQSNISSFLDDCKYMKGLSDKILKACMTDSRKNTVPTEKKRQTKSE